MSDIIDKIKQLFVDEAINSPLLFNDLANMEKYISESYTGRSLIELLQNADDAGAKRFAVELIDNHTYLVANDGREFTNEDILSLCRSGASTKKRNGNTIGFRGIGFKSIVNYAETVHLISGEIEATFSRSLTKKELPHAEEVPMIRIPHTFCGQQYLSIINEYKAKGYHTVFAFEVNNNSLSDEIKEFDCDAMLFLQSINTAEFITNQKKIYTIQRDRVNNLFYSVKAINGEKSETWLVTASSDSNEKSAIAFKYDGERIIEADRKESVVHSFMPTHNALSIPFKINGDFSTDPSRTKVVIDTDSRRAADKCASIVAGLFKDILSNCEDRYGLVNLIKKARIDPLYQIKGEDINDIFVNILRDKIQKNLYEAYGDGKELFLQPNGISNDDFINITNRLSVKGIGNEDEKRIPGLIEMMKAFGFKELPVEQCLEAMGFVECSEKTRETVLVNTINKSRFGIDDSLREKISTAKLFSFQSGVTSLADAKETDTVDSVFEGAVTEVLTTPADYSSFAKRIGLKTNQLAMNNKSKKDIVHVFSNASVTTKTGKYSKNRVITKWRSVEKNVAAVLELLDDVVSVTDVSTRNLGYDLEAVLINGSKRYYEVKSVTSLGDIFSFSNNEYSTAMQYKADYYLAITCQNDSQITICFVADPVNSLMLTKRVTRWEWICNEYKGEVVTTDMK